MKVTLELLKEKKWAFVLIFFIVFFIPLFYFWADDVSTENKCYSLLICFVTGIALSVIDLFFKGRSEKIYLFVLFLLSLAPNMITWGYLYISDIYMKRDMFWVIFNTQYTESKEYFDTFISWQIIVVGAVYLVAGIFFILKARSVHSLPVKKYRYIFAFSILIVLTDFSLQYLSQSIPTFEFYKSYFSFWHENQKFEKERHLREHLTMDIACTLPDSVPHVFVVLIGESTSICHMSLYGYHRETTPRMDACRDELDVYTDVVPPDTHTYGVLQKALTFANHEHPEYYMEKPSLVEVFNSAGYETYWISNQPFLGKWGASYGVIASESAHTYDLSTSKQHDEIVLPTLKEILNDGITKNKIIFIHLLGNHHAYISRYPDEFDHFNHKRDNDLDDLGFRNDLMKKTIDEYDNATLYGDFVYESALNELRKLNCSSYLLFFSDHGEEIYETRNASGHFMKNVYPCQCQVPFVLWRSEKYKEENLELVIDTDRPYNTEDLIYSLSTLSGLNYQDNDQSLSIFSPKYVVPEKRLVGRENYEDILKKIK
jgi:heptose-I-phosphate ethanolaminephosphotransferase